VPSAADRLVDGCNRIDRPNDRLAIGPVYGLIRLHYRNCIRWLMTIRLPFLK
jgi:hypothetical protein